MDTVTTARCDVAGAQEVLLSSDGLKGIPNLELVDMNIGSVEEWLRPALGAMVLLGGASVLVYVVVHNYRPADPSGFVSVSDRSAVETSASTTPVLPGTETPISVTDPKDSQGPCGSIAAEFKEVRAALARPQADPESNYLKRRFQELRSRAHASNCPVVPEG